MLKEFGLEPVDDNYESPVWSDSDADSWGDEENVQNIEPNEAFTSTKNTEPDTDKKLIHSSHINECLASPSLSKQEGSIDNKVIYQQKNIQD